MYPDWTFSAGDRVLDDVPATISGAMSAVPVSPVDTVAGVDAEALVSSSETIG